MSKAGLNLPTYEEVTHWIWWVLQPLKRAQWTFELDETFPSNHSLINYSVTRSDAASRTQNPMRVTWHFVCWSIKRWQTIRANQDPRFSEYAKANQLAERLHVDKTSMLDSVASTKTKLVNDEPRAPWFNETIRKAKTEQRGLERRWKTSPPGFKVSEGHYGGTFLGVHNMWR